MLASTDFWNAVAFFAFMAIAWRFGAFRAILSGLDGRGRRIRAELEEAKRLRAEADELLAAYKTRQAEAEREAADIVAAAREEAERIARESSERMAEFVKRRTASAEAKIAQAEAQAAQQVRAAAAEAAVRVSEIVLRDQLRAGAADDVMRRSLGEVRGKLDS